MGVTLFSFILLPLCALWCFRPMRLLQLLFIVAIFEAAAAVTVGGLGVQPGLVPAIAFVLYVMLQMILGASYPGQQAAWRMVSPLVLVGTWALASSFLMPRLFEGEVYVWPQKSLPPFVLTLLEPTSSNLNQDFYLLLNLVVLVVAALFLTKSDIRLKPLLDAYLISIGVAAFVAVWQFASKMAHVPYPDALFYSNPGWAILTEQTMGAIPRINGSFAEPSSLGSYMAAAACCTGWLTIQGHRDRILRVIFVVSVCGVLLSTSTTGIVSLAMAGALVIGMAVGGGSTRMVGAILKYGIPLVVLIAFLGFLATVLAPSILDSLGDIFDATANKGSSSSFNDRTSTDIDSINAALGTYGLGVGWGSDRSSSLIPGLLAGVGFPGLAGILWFAVALARRVRAARRSTCDADTLTVIDGCCGALVGYLLAAVLSAPTLSAVGFFVLLAMLIAAVARAEIHVPARRVAVRASAELAPFG